MTGKIAIRFASGADEGAILAFLRSHWRENHIFVIHPEVMRWQHQSSSTDKPGLNFVLAERVSNEGATDLMGLLGFIPFRHFDPAADWSEIALAIWKVREDAGAPGLGLQLLKTLQRTLNPSMVCAIGISPVVKPIYKVLGYRLGALSQAVIFPAQKPAATLIAQNVPASAYQPIHPDPTVTLRDLPEEPVSGEISADSIDALSIGRLPRKSLAYIRNRYLRHPWYRYQLKTILADGRLRAVIVLRRVDVPHLASQVLRIVDVIGDAEVLARCGHCLQQLVQRSGCEYLDLMQHGMDGQALAAGGFVTRGDHPSMVVPNYFEPFESRNVDIELAYRVEPDFSNYKVCLFRADSDQDRPNLPSAFKTA